VLMVGGGASITDVLRRAGLSGDSHGTVASWIAEKLQRGPRPGDEVDLHGADVVVRRIRRGRVFDATLRRPS
jgi:CBS domain containing-hemolysin-like protein